MDPLIIAPSENAAAPMPPLTEAMIEQLAELWCEALLANLRRHPIEPNIRKVS